MPPSKKAKIGKQLAEWKHSMHAMESFVTQNEDRDWQTALPMWLRQRGEEMIALGHAMNEERTAKAPEQTEFPAEEPSDA